MMFFGGFLQVMVPSHLIAWNKQTKAMFILVRFNFKTTVTPVVYTTPAFSTLENRGFGERGKPRFRLKTLRFCFSVNGPKQRFVFENDCVSLTTV